MTATKTIDLINDGQKCPGCGRVEPWHSHPCPELARRIAALRAMEASNGKGDKQ